MSNNYVPNLTDLLAGELARAADINTRYGYLVSGFDKLPAPLATGQGFSDPVVVGTPTLDTHAVPKSVMDAVETGVITNRDATAASAAAALVSETNAAASAVASAASATSSATAQTAAETAKTGAETAETGSVTAKTAAEAAEAAALVSQNAAAGSASAAAASVASIGTAVTDAQTAATSAETHLDDFQDIYLGAASNDPLTDLDGDPLASGALFFKTASNQLRVYDGTGWRDAGSAVNGTSSRDTFIATSGQTTFALSGSYDVGFVDVYLNGIKLLSGTDFTATNGSSIVLTAPAALNDVVDVVAYGTFTVLQAIGNTDGGFANSTYTTAQNIDGGGASG